MQKQRTFQNIFAIAGYMRMLLASIALQPISQLQLGVAGWGYPAIPYRNRQFGAWVELFDGVGCMDCKPVRARPPRMESATDTKG